jgi:hypothetical protein
VVESAKKTRGGREHKEDQGWKRKQRRPGVRESTKRTKGWETAQRGPGGGRKHKED